MVSTNTSQKRQKKIPIENDELFISTGKLVAKAKPKPKSVVNSSVNVPIHDQNTVT